MTSEDAKKEVIDLLIQGFYQKSSRLFDLKLPWCFVKILMSFIAYSTKEQHAGIVNRSFLLPEHKMEDP